MFNEIKENEFNLNVPRYVDISESEEQFDIQKTIDELKMLETERDKIENQVMESIRDLGFKL